MGLGTIVKVFLGTRLTEMVLFFYIGEFFDKFLIPVRMLCNVHKID